MGGGTASAAGRAVASGGLIGPRSNEQHRLVLLAHVERMLGLTAGVAFETECLAAVEVGENLLVAPEVGAVLAPTEHHTINFGAPMRDPAVVVGPDWVGGAFHIGRLGCSPGEEVEHDKIRVAPGGGKIADAAQGWVELVLVRGYA